MLWIQERRELKMVKEQVFMHLAKDNVLQDMFGNL
jgi:hypothetical protein